MISGKFTCPNCQKHFELSTTAAPSQQSSSNSKGLGGLLAQIEDVLLTGKEVEFVAQTRERYEKYGDTTRMTDKQLDWLRKIAATNGVD